MAPLVAVLGSAIGGAVFGSAAAGWIVGSILGNILFPSGGGNQEGPRLDDLSVTSSAYGVAIPKNFGTVKHAGNIIWALPVREVKKEEKSGGKGGGSKVTTYSYFATLAIGISQGVADRVLRIWANEKLIFDTGSEVNKSIIDLIDTSKIILFQVLESSPWKIRTGLDFTFYEGTEDQEIDPLILADKGTEAIPYKGLCYIVIDDIPLADYGNAIPSFKIEVAYKSTTTFNDSITITPQNGTPTIEPSTDSIAVDWLRRKAYGASGFNPTTIIGIDLDSMNETASGTITGGDFLGLRVNTVTVGRVDGFIYSYTSSGNSNRTVRIDPVTMDVVGSFGFSNNSLSFSQTSFPLSVGFVTVVVRGPNGDEEFLLTAGLLSTGFGILKLPTLEYINHSNFFSVIKMARGEERIGSSDVYFASTTTISKIVIFDGARFSSLLGGTLGVDVDTTPRIVFADRLVSNMYWDDTDNTLIVEYDLISPDIRGYMKLEVVTWTTVWDTGGLFGTGNSISQGGPNSSFYKNGVGVFATNSSDAIFIDLQTGKVEHSAQVPALNNHGQGFAFNSGTMEGVQNGGVNGIGRIDFFRTGQEGEKLSSIVSYLCNKVGLVPADINVTELTDTIDGFSLTRVAPARTWIDMLARIYFFEGMESDYILNFPKKQKASSVSIPQTDLINIGGEGKGTLSVNTIQEPELPRLVELNYINRLTSYEPGTARSQRIISPTPVVFSNNKVNFGLPVVLQPLTAKRMTEVMLYTSWLERDNYQWKLPYKYLKLDTTDVVTITSNIGVFTSRVTKIDLSGDLILSFAGISHEESNYTSIVDSDGGIIIPQTIPGRNFTKLTMLPVPLLIPSDDTSGTGLRMYYVMTGIGQPRWIGGVLFRSPTSGDFNVNPTDQSTVEATTGTTTDILGGSGFPNTVDTINSVNFVLSTGSNTSFTSRTILDMFNDKVTALIIGNEMIRYATVVIETNGSVTVSDLIRGQKNTEGAMGSHAVGDKVILLDKNSVKSFVEGVNDFGSNFFYKAVGFDELISTTETITQNSSGEAEKPYSIVQLKETPSGGDSVITWERRSRLDDSAFLNGTGTNSVGETLEQYELEIIEPNSLGILELVILNNIRSYTITTARKLFYVGSTGAPISLTGIDLDCDAITGWVIDTGNIQLRTTNPLPQQGTAYIMGTGAQDSLVHQDIEVPTAQEVVIDEGRMKADLKWWQASFALNNDSGTMRIEYYDASMNKLGATQSLPVDNTTPSQVFAQRTLNTFVPALTRTIRIFMEFKWQAGTNTDAYFDDVTLELVQTAITDVAIKVYQISELVGRGRQLEQVTFTL